MPYGLELNTLAPLLQICALLGSAWIIHLLTKTVIFKLLRFFALKAFGETAEKIGEVVFERIALMVPFLVIIMGTSFLGESVPEDYIALIQRVGTGITILLVARVISALLDSVQEAYQRRASAYRRPIKGYLQVIAVFVYFFAAIMAIAAVINKSPLLLISGLGAMTAVLMLVFRDTILSLVAGVQLTANDLLRVGDWIEMPQFNADGDVIDIALNVVKVQNWDKTITVIPAHKFIENSFKNWRGMQESGGRRIKI